MCLLRLIRSSGLTSIAAGTLMVLAAAAGWVLGIENDNVARSAFSAAWVPTKVLKLAGLVFLLPGW